MGLKPRNPPEDVWDCYWSSVCSRAEWGVGWVLASLGAIIVGSWAAWMWIGELLADSHLPLIVRWGVVGLLLGPVILAVSVVRHRINPTSCVMVLAAEILAYGDAVRLGEER